VDGDGDGDGSRDSSTPLHSSPLRKTILSQINMHERCASVVLQPSTPYHIAFLPGPKLAIRLELETCLHSQSAEFAEAKLGTPTSNGGYFIKMSTESLCFGLQSPQNHFIEQEHG
jgi:hypothetical protein